ncbi:MAG: succinate dehydrogenase, hydrophobic membrane anchor protein [Gammaproteobacteria bacterium]|jgi:succinate dehydrogenase / fumarate reductase membrane anchor subunit|nr:succinate dehydrogenase, hydrophobic membrane anchor protein [Gammaproteobacteria bacterium]
MNSRSPLGSALGHGSAGSGTGHWWGQRLSAVALVPLTLWFAVSLLGLPGLDYYTVSAWAAAPLHAILLVLLVIALVYHSALGTQVIAEDYIHTPGSRIVVLALLRFAHIALAAAGVFSVFLIATRAGA